MEQGTSKMKHLTNEPIGEDWYDGKAQTALANRIVAEIILIALIASFAGSYPASAALCIYSLPDS